MRKLLLIISLILFPLTSQAVEHVIGISGGYGLNKSELRHSVIRDYGENPNFDTNKPVNNDNPTRLRKFFVDNSKNINGGYNFDLEYQARFNSIVLGIGYSNSKISINPNYQNLENINYEINNPYFLAMVTPLKTNLFALRGGFTAGYDFLKLDSNNTKKPSASVVVDGEYIFSNHFMLFSRVSYKITRGSDVYLNKPDVVINDAQNGNVIFNQLRINPQEFLLKLNFGVRYKV